MMLRTRGLPSRAGIYWLASFPKSGNTWFRMFLANLLYPAQAPCDINQLPLHSANSSDRVLIDELLGIFSGRLSHAEVDLLRPACYDWLVAEHGDETLFLKAHDAWTLNANGQPVLSASASLGALYFVRNPLDVAVSYAHHMGVELDVTIQRMGDAANSTGRRASVLAPNLRQLRLSWSGNAASWLSQHDIPVHLMRYEDMRDHTLVTFRRAVAFLGITCTDGEIETALAHASFDRLQRQESQGGFRERPPKAPVFFRSGRVGGWREVLSERQRDQLIADHREMMCRLGYLDEADNLLY